MSRRPAIQLSGTVLAVLAVLVAWDAFFVTVNFLMRSVDVRSMLQAYDPWFMKPFVDFATSIFGWISTALANALVFIILFVISLVYELTEVEW